MDRSTTREEYQAFMRKWRAVLGNAAPPDNFWKYDKLVQGTARSIVFNAVYELIPPEFWDYRRESPAMEPVWPSKAYWMFAKYNMAHAANSHPHKTRNP